MGASIIEQVIDTLTDAGIRAERGFPGKRMPALEAPGVAVSLAKQDQASGTATVQAAVLCPASLGGEECETLAVQVYRTIQSMGADCAQGSCGRIGQTDLLCVYVSAVFYGQEGPDGWSKITVELAGVDMPRAVTLAAWQSVDATVTTLSSTAWSWRLEEMFLPDDTEQAEPQEPFLMTVVRGSRKESYTACTLTSRRVEVTSSGLRRIREGVAQSRTVTTVS